MKRAIVSVILLTLLASTAAMAAVPVTVWIHDDFSTYPTNTRLRFCAPNWQDDPLQATGMHLAPQTEFSYDTNATAQALRFNGTWGNAAIQAAETTASFGTLATNNVVTFHFMARRGSTYSTTILNHAYIYVFDSTGTEIGEWYGGSGGLAPRYPDPITQMAVVGPAYVIADDNWHDFDIVYDPGAITDNTKWYVDGTVQWTQTRQTGASVNKIKIKELKTTGLVVDHLFMDDVALGTGPMPVLTAPRGAEWLGTTTPTVTWTTSIVTPDTMTGYRVIVCDVDSSTATPIYDSGDQAGSATSFAIPTALPANQYLYAFVREQSGIGWSPYSAIGSGGFYITTAAPSPAPTVTAPSGTVVGAKPMVQFTAPTHNLVNVKICTDIAGTSVVWDSGTVATQLNGTAVQYMLAAGTQYYAFARVGNPSGWSDWSAGLGFQITREGEGIDSRTMRETWNNAGVIEDVLTHVAAPPDDGFRRRNESGLWAFWSTDSVAFPINLLSTCGTSLIDFTDYGPGLNSEGMLRHGVLDINLDNGVTMITSVRIPYQHIDAGYPDQARIPWQRCSMLVADNGRMAAVLIRQSLIGICTDGINWTTAALAESADWRTVRITGRNRVVGDSSTAQWNVYVNETLAVSGTGTMEPYDTGDYIAIGQGCYGIAGTWQYDWTFVNTAGDYAPGDWGNPFGGQYDTISAAKRVGESMSFNVTGEAVVTRLQTDLTGAQTGFWVQDIGTVDHAGVLIKSTTTSPDIAVGKKITGISGILGREDGVGAIVSSATFSTPGTTADATPAVMNEKALVAGGCVTQAAEGAENVGMYVRVIGRLSRVIETQTPFPDGGYTFYLDDGSGLIDGRSTDEGDPLATGIRFLITKPAVFTPVVGDKYVVDGIAGYETWEEGTDPNIVTKTVRVILFPTFTAM